MPDTLKKFHDAYSLISSASVIQFALIVADDIIQY